MSLRSWASVATIVLLVLIVFFARHEIADAWELLGTVNLWILALIVPGQIVVYFVAGEMMFSYLRDKKIISHISIWSQARMALEMNFVNHTLPSAGLSGLSYMSWRLHKYGISPGRATLAQLIRFVASFAAYVVLLMVGLLAITIDGSINRWMILLGSAISFAMIAGTSALVYLVSSPRRSDSFSSWVVRVVNRIVRTVTGGKKRQLLTHDTVQRFFREMHDDYLELKRNRRILLKPFLWGIVFTMGEILLFWITFWALGSPINPAPLLLAYGVGIMASFVMVTPGGAGAFEAVMVSVLAIAGVPAGTAIAGIVLTRVLLLAGTIGLGYFFYQHALVKYGKSKSSL